MADDAQFPIKITGDASSLVGATKDASAALNKVGGAQEEAGKASEKHGAHLQGLHKVINALNQVVPGLGVIMQAAFSPIGAAISLAVMAMGLFRDKIKEVNAELDKMLRTKYATPFRQTIVDGATADLGRQIESQQACASAEQKRDERRQSKLRTLSRNLKMTISPTAARRPETLPAVERLTELLKEEENT